MQSHFESTNLFPIFEQLMRTTVVVTKAAGLFAIILRDRKRHKLLFASMDRNTLFGERKSRNEPFLGSMFEGIKRGNRIIESTGSHPTKNAGTGRLLGGRITAFAWGM